MRSEIDKTQVIHKSIGRVTLQQLAELDEVNKSGWENRHLVGDHWVACNSTTVYANTCPISAAHHWRNVTCKRCLRSK